MPRNVEIIAAEIAVLTGRRVLHDRELRPLLKELGRACADRFILSYQSGDDFDQTADDAAEAISAAVAGILRGVPFRRADESRAEAHQLAVHAFMARAAELRARVPDREMGRPQ